VLRVLVTVLAIICCLLLMWLAARIGYPRLPGKYAVVTSSPPAADQDRLAPLSEQNRSELVRQLIAAKAFRQAFELWRTDESLKPPLIFNGGFEEPLRNPFSDTGFDWYVFAKSEARIAADESEKLSGGKSLLIAFSGEWKAVRDVISQRIVVDPDRRYRITFGVKTKELVTGAPPAIVIIDAANNQRLGLSQAFPSPTSDWQKISFEFSTAPATQAIVLELTKVEGACAPCPIFGTLWLDDFLIEHVTPVTPTSSQR
jgi:Carbohydrate binding domain